MDFVLLIAGGALVLLSLGQLGLWAAVSLRNAVAEGRQLELRQRLIQQEIEAARSRGEIQEAGTTAWQGFRRFIVDKVVPETATAVSVYLVPQDRKPLPRFLPGQHLTMRFVIPGETKPLIRCYSLSDRHSPEQYRITVKQISRPHGSSEDRVGKVSNFVNGQLSPGMLIDVKAPSGSFHLDLLDQRAAILVAAGVGITPLLSMIETSLASSKEREVLLVYGVRNTQDHLFKQRIKDLSERYKNFNAVHCYSAPLSTDQPGSDYQFKGRVDIELLKKMLPSNNFHFYLCGPGPFMESMYQGLRGWNVGEEQIHYEAFGPSSIGKSPVQVVTATENAEDSSRVRFLPGGQSLLWDGTSRCLLDAAESAGIELESGCRAGSCGSCRMKLAAGQVKYPSGKPEDLEPGSCLPCICIPDGDIEVEV